ncbi:WDR54 protein, partial [Bucorvus abyssinicus]|nr:WDR54 protein [Bucorvus abyssinicus]
PSTPQHTPARPSTPSPPSPPRPSRPGQAASRSPGNAGLAPDATRLRHHSATPSPWLRPTPGEPWGAVPGWRETREWHEGPGEGTGENSGAAEEPGEVQGGMYRKEPSIPLRSSSAALYNNLSVLRPPGRPLACLGAVHGPGLSLVTVAADGLGFSHRQLQAKEGGTTLSTSLLTQAVWCVLPSRVLLVLTSQRGIQMYESDGSIMVYWHALDVTEHPPAQAVFARGIAAAAGDFICVGTSSGAVLVFDIPPKGTNITVSEVLEQHHDAITDIAAELGQAPDGAGDVVTADDAGMLCIWGAGEEFALLSKIPACGCSCSSVKLWNGIVAAGYGNGQIRLYEAVSGVLRAEVNAHARWIYALDLAPETGKLLSGAEDSFVHVWKLSRDLDTDDIEVEHCHAECVTDTQVCGARFCDPQGNSFAVTGYDLSEIFRYGQA